MFPLYLFYGRWAKPEDLGYSKTVFSPVIPGWGPVPLVLSYVAFVGFLGSMALVVLTLQRGLHSGLNRSVAGFGVAYGLWSLAYTLLYVFPGGQAPEIVFALATVGMFGLPVASLGILFSVGRLGRIVPWMAGLAMTSTAVFTIGWSLVRHRFFPELQTFSLDGATILSGERLIPWMVYAVNGLGFTAGFFGLIRARAALGSRRLRRQATLVGVQLLAGVGSYAVVSGVELVLGWPPVGMLTLLYSLFLNFHLASKYGYLAFDLPHLGPEIIDALGESVFLLDAQGQIRKANPAGVALCAGLGPAEGLSFSALFSDPGLVQTTLVVVGVSGDPTRKTGVSIGAGTATVSVSPHYDRFRDLVGFVAIVERSDAFDNAATRLGLSPREKEVAQLLVQGLSVKQMAEASFVSEATIKTHLLHLYRKSGAKNRVTFLQNILQSR